MKYITGEFALNIPCSLKTTGDWHYNSYPLEKAKELETDNSFYKDFGIEKHIIKGKNYNIANHLRAILDLIINKKFGYLKGFKNDFIVVDDYDTIFFDNVYKLRNSKIWNDVDNLMKNEYMLKWIYYKENKGV